MAKRRPLAVPELGSCATTGRAWRLWAASTLPEEGGWLLGAPPLPQLLESATSKTADPADIWFLGVHGASRHTGDKPHRRRRRRVGRRAVGRRGRV